MCRTSIRRSPPGLAEYGYSGLAITPEFGARVRFVTVITDAELTPSPLLEPGSVCDSCMICKRECRSGALSKEIKGWNVIEYEGRQYRYANKNLWRCSWGEHFDLDLDLPIPDVVDEKVIMEATVKYGRRGGEMGSCLRYCLPKALRYWDRDYTNAPAPAAAGISKTRRCRGRFPAAFSKRSGLSAAGGESIMSWSGAPTNSGKAPESISAH